jgi:hypothetical protein
MPLASGSFPYRPRARVAPREGGENENNETGEDKDGGLGTARDPASSQSYASEDGAADRREEEAALNIAHEEADSTYAPPPVVTAPAAPAEPSPGAAPPSQPGHWLPPSTGGADKGGFVAPHLGKRALILPLDQRPADKRKVQTIAGSAPLIGASTAFAAIAL